MTDHLGAVLRAHKAGESVGVTSVCSAHPLVLVAAMRQAAADGGFLLVEATSNQVDQFGGYTGMRPADFRDFVLRIADDEGFPRDAVVLGGDHLGPNAWQSEEPEPAMQKAVDLVAAYAAAGYTKLHLDCSMRLSGDPEPLPDALVAERAARLLAAAEDAAPDPAAIRYVIGTEVPVPGGAHETIDTLAPTPPDAARATLDAHRAAFRAAGVEPAWSRVMALVVQPAVEFDHVRVVDYDPARTVELQHVLDDEPAMVFEAHSTDYQLPEALAALVTDHWAVLKVGPGLTFALREGVFALAAIEQQLMPEGERSDVIDVIEQVMLADPGRWERYYEGDADEQRVARRFSYSDRMRYYLPDPQIVAALDRLLANLARTGVPEPLISQYLPEQYLRVRRRELGADPRELLIDRVRDALRPYSAATVPAGTGEPEAPRIDR
ncbi:D-tagatose-bisphosphate aldolase, class II, non-catalytic subunit [Amnibacterium sp. CER49]|uniref:D-tagatose-bisphosphate aldolase, class II, non-catalytic subunit n=1 Tax=Amnibacterium sp. CER49 TaxID=3039161 RepID=UPI00244A145B|nr:D-tagatose-bisphosphate aldolase, class II, non-catalytic subunit [Amnibacterium sp. CER49]MDH2442600.1 D-tagatose-bisphosphate aldolase, class II, non-catalytic subunit [Amnibacterium sp. CER49]